MKTLEQKKSDLKKLKSSLTKPHIPENVKPKLRGVVDKLEKEIEEEERGRETVIEPIVLPVVKEVEEKKPVVKKTVAKRKAVRKATPKRATPVKKEVVPVVEKKPKKKVSETIRERIKKDSEKREKSVSKEKEINKNRTMAILKKIEADKKKKTFNLADLRKLANEINDMRLPHVVERDKATASNRRLAVSHNNILRWGMSPGRYDLIGIDCLKTATPTVIAREVTKSNILDFFGF